MSYSFELSHSQLDGPYTFELDDDQVGFNAVNYAWPEGFHHRWEVELTNPGDHGWKVYDLHTHPQDLGHNSIFLELRDADTDDLILQDGVYTLQVGGGTSGEPDGVTSIDVHPPSDGLTVEGLGEPVQQYRFWSGDSPGSGWI